MDLLEEAQHQQGITELPIRLRSALVHETLKLLPRPGRPASKQRIDLRFRTITHGSLHRHLVTIRCPDQAFYLDAIKGYLQRSDIQPIGQQTMVAAMQCDEELCDIHLRHPDQQSDDNFMFIALHISATLVPDCTPLIHDIGAILRAVDLSVTDFPQMLEKVAVITERVAREHPPSAELLSWMSRDQYLFFGMQLDGTRLGLLRDYRAMEHVAPGLRQQIEAIEPSAEPGIEWLHLAACQHYLYSAANIQAVRICWLDNKGEPKNGTIIGHFSRSARHTNASQVPCIRDDWQALQKLSVLKHSAFYRREIRTIYDRMPKPLLHSVAASDWLGPLKAIVDMTSPTQTTTARLTPRRGNLDYLLVAMPANRFGPNVLHHIETAVTGNGATFHGTESFGVGPYRIILLAVQLAADADLTATAEQINECIIFWKDRAKQELLSHAAEVDLPATLKELEKLPALYQELFPPEQFLDDIRARDYVLATCRTMVRVQPRQSGKGNIELHIITCRTMPLGELVDKIQAFGVTAIQESVVDFGQQESPIRISCIRCETKVELLPDDMERLRLGLELVFNDEADHDPLNALLTATSLDIDETGILISLRNHLVQLMPEAAPMLLTRMLLGYPQVSERLLQLFKSLHLPSSSAEYFAQVRMEFDQAMADVHSLTDDRWFRALEKLVSAGLRTNAFVREQGEPFAFKIDPAEIDFAPTPRPYREIFVHGVHVEGIHLRGGPIARGGIRYSDRPADFRTEVLELMATQVVKNGQIVPTGAKGGFVVRDGSGPDFVLKQYRTFIRTLLDLTDNLVHGEAIAPDGIRIAEPDRNDPYLVVAADKGTARFSDDANEESRLTCFWLDDAFASGGSQGYDHKAVGITARGAWVCAGHHFELLGRDAWNDPLTVIGIGDMGGDVFGNGMLLNPNIRLVGAFNHSHIFLDPDPDVKRAYAERRRLFEASAGWEQYNLNLVSSGGGVFLRSAKAVTLNAAAREVLGIENSVLSGEALIQALLRAPVDMLYNGGIGTYIKASGESHHNAQDPANNSVRIDATELKTTVVCEGGNLGMTQSARLEYAGRHGTLNTDAIDNSAGVDMSDHEVNLKILFTTPQLIQTPVARRNRTLKQLQDAVTEQCLNNNLDQSRTLTLAAQDAAEYLPRIAKLRDTLVTDGRLNRRIDTGISDDATLVLRPQLAVLLGHEKNRIHDTLDSEQFHTGSCFSDELLKSYFPTALQHRMLVAMQQHPLAMEIIHTQATNHIINQLGLTSVHNLQSLLDRPVSSIVQALLLAEKLLDAEMLRESIWATVSDKKVAIGIQRSIQEHVSHFAEELLRLCRVHDLDMEWIARQQRGLRRFRKSLGAQGIGGAENSRYLELLKSASQAGLSSSDAAHLAAMPELTQMATAVHIGATESLPLSHCLKAVQACMHLLPFQKLESALRTPAWADAEAHPLRREWLHRLTLLKQRATGQILKQSSRSLLEGGRKLWGEHKHWPLLQQIVHGGTPDTASPATNGGARLKLILALTHLESAIDESR